MKEIPDSLFLNSVLQTKKRKTVVEMDHCVHFKAYLKILCMCVLLQSDLVVL